MTPTIYLHLADCVLLLHFAWVTFVVIGLPAFWLGAWFRWIWVRSFALRLAHLLAIGFVAFEALTGRDCPLTIWENRLRILAGSGQSYESSFLQHWLHRVLFYEFSETAFTVAYSVFFVLVIITLCLVPPRFPVSVRKCLGKPPTNNHR